MNRLILVAVFVCLTISYVSCVDLSYLCKEDVFKFKEDNNTHLEHRIINSFYRLSLTNELPKVKHYMVTHLDEPKFLKDEALKSFKKAKYDYEKLLLVVYSENFINHLNNKEFDVIGETFQDYKKVEAEMKEVLSLDKGYPQDEVEKARKTFSENMKRIEDLLQIYILGRKNFMIPALINAEDLGAALHHLHNKLESHQIPSFEGLFIYAYYEHPIATVTGFKLDRASKMFFSPESKGTISFDVVIPFENKNYEKEIDKVKCVKAKGNLPAFYTHDED